MRLEFSNSIFEAFSPACMGDVMRQSFANSIFEAFFAWGDVMRLEFGKFQLNFRKHFSLGRCHAS